MCLWLFLVPLETFLVYGNSWHRYPKLQDIILDNWIPKVKVVHTKPSTLFQKSAFLCLTNLFCEVLRLAAVCFVHLKMQWHLYLYVFRKIVGSDLKSFFKFFPPLHFRIDPLMSKNETCSQM